MLRSLATFGRRISLYVRVERLCFERVKKSKRPPLRLYGCHNLRECPARWECSQEKRGRTIELREHHGALLRQREKQRDPEKRSALKQRIVINEPVFGWIKEGMGFRPWTYNGLESVRAQWSMLCTVNLGNSIKASLGGRFALG
jgi:Transposase DDE domain